MFHRSEKSLEEARKQLDEIAFPEDIAYIKNPLQKALNALEAWENEVWIAVSWSYFLPVFCFRLYLFNYPFAYFCKKNVDNISNGSHALSGGDSWHSSYWLIAHYHLQHLMRNSRLKFNVFDISVILKFYEKARLSKSVITISNNCDARANNVWVICELWSSHQSQRQPWPKYPTSNHQNIP